ncbi:MAG: hypothetical protein ACM3ZF_05145 [Mycobacterium leprae]
MSGRRRANLLIIDWVFNVDTKQFTEIVCEVEGYPGWRIIPEVVATDRGLALKRLTIEPKGDLPEGGITTQLLRQLRTGALIASLRAAANQLDRYVGIRPDLAVSTRVGRRGRDDRYYAGWAAAYVEALTRSPNPIHELSHRHHLSDSALRNLMHACRRRGLLTPSPRGRAGGELTPKARRLLEESQ